MEVSNGSMAMLDKLLGNEALVRITPGPTLNGGGTGKGVLLPSSSLCTVKLPLLQSTTVSQSGMPTNAMHDGAYPPRLCGWLQCQIFVVSVMFGFLPQATHQSIFAMRGILWYWRHTRTNIAANFGMHVVNVRASVTELFKQGMAPPNMYCSFTVSQSVQCEAPSDGAFALSQLHKSVEATSLHVDRVMEEGRKVLHGGKGSRGGGSSRKRNRSRQTAGPVAADTVIEEGLPATKIVCSRTRQHAVNHEKVKKMSSRRSHGQGLKRREKKGCQQPVSTLTDQPLAKGRSTNVLARSGTTGILDLYGLKAKPVDLARHMIDVSLDQLLSESCKSSEVSGRDVGGTEGNLENLIKNVLTFLPKPLNGSAHLFSSCTDSANAPNSKGQSAKLLLDLESAFQVEEEVAAEISERKATKEKLAKDMPVLSVNKESEIDGHTNGEINLSMLDLSTRFSVHNLPAFPLEDFLSRLKLPPSTPLDLLVSDSKLEEVVDVIGPPISSSIHNHSMPQLPFSLPSVGPIKSQVDYDKSGKSGKVYERRWFRGGNNEIDAKGYKALIRSATEGANKSVIFASANENLNGKIVDGRTRNNSKTISGEQAVLSGSGRFTLDAKGDASSSIYAASDLQFGVSGNPEPDCNEGSVLGKPAMKLEAKKESLSSVKWGEESPTLQARLATGEKGSFIEKQETSCSAAHILSTSKPFCRDEMVEPQIQARLSDVHLKDPKEESQHHGSQLVEERAPEEPSLFAARSSNFSALQIKCRPRSYFPLHQSSSNSPVAPNSPGVEDAAQLLCCMANSVPPLSLEKSQCDKGKRPRLFQPYSGGPTQTVAKIARTDSNMDRYPFSLHTESEEIAVRMSDTAARCSGTLKKVPTSEKKKGISHVSQISTSFEKLAGSAAYLPAGGASRGSFPLLAARSGNCSTKFEKDLRHCTKETRRETNIGGCSVLPKTLSKVSYQPVKPDKEFLTLKVRTFTGGPPKQKGMMATDFTNVSLNSGGSKVLAEVGTHASRSSQKIAPTSSLDSVLGLKADNSFIVPVKSWRNNHPMEKQETRQRQDPRYSKR